MVTMEKNIFEKYLGKRMLPQEIKIDDAKSLVHDGLRYFIGDNAQWVKEYDDVCAWLSDNKRKGLLLYGTNGMGKTLICYCVIPVLLKELYRDIRIFKTRANNLRELQQKSKDYYDFILSKVVFVDDFGTESIANNFGEKRDMFSEVVDIAEQENMILVLTTNLTPKEILDRYGARTLDRLHAITTPICMQGKSFR